MILHSLELHSFGPFRQARFEFGPGLNLVLGPNGAGKSTLMEGIPAALFGSRKKERYPTWGQAGECRVSAEFRHADGLVRIERDMLSDQVVLQEERAGSPPFRFEGRVAPGGRSAEREEYLDRLSACFGAAEEEIFRASLFYGQGSLEIAPRNGMEGKIKKLLSGSVETDYDQVLASLAADYFQVTRTNPWGRDKLQPRELEKVRARIQEVEHSRRENRDRLARLEALRNRIDSLRTAMDRDRAELDRGRRYRDWLSKRLALADKEARLQEDFQRLQREAARVEALHRERRELEENREGPHLFEELPALLPELRGLRRQVPTLEEQIAELSGRRPAGTGASWAGLAGLAGLIAGAGLLILRQRPDLLGPVAGTGGAVFLLFFLNCLKRSRRVWAQRSLIRGQLQVLEENLSAVRRRLAELEGRLEEQGLSPGDSGLEALQQRMDQEERRRQRLREIRSALEVLTDLSALEGQKDALARELAVLRAQQGEPARPVRAEELAATERKLTLLEQRLAGTEQDLAGALREESFLLGELGDFQGQAEEQEFLQEKERALMERKEVLTLAFDLLSDAVRDFRQESLERFTAAAGRALARVTAGRYDRVRMEEGFRFSLGDADGTWRPLDCFSRGTMDAVFFAIRLVLARELFGERRLPLLLDDPMVNFDFQRLSDTLKYLETTAPEYQTLLFSHNRGLLSLVDRPRWQVTDLAAVF